MPERWPRGLSVEDAAEYVGVSIEKFRQEVAAGIWPAGDPRGRRRIWDRALLDQAYDARSGLGETRDLEAELLRRIETGRTASVAALEAEALRRLRERRGESIKKRRR